MARPRTVSATRASSRPTLASPLGIALAFAPFAVVSIVHLVSKITDGGWLDFGTKPLLMPTLAFAFILLGRHLSRITQALMLAGLLFSWIGDVTVGNLVVGLLFFLIAHLAYIALFLITFDRRGSWWSLLAVPWFVAFIALLADSLGDFFVPVAVYGLVLGVMAVSATRGNVITIAGGILFVISDSLLALRLFSERLQDPTSDVLIMGLYLLAQAALVAGVLLRDESWVPGNRSARG